MSRRIRKKKKNRIKIKIIINNNIIPQSVLSPAAGVFILSCANPGIPDSTVMSY